MGTFIVMCTFILTFAIVCGVAQILNFQIKRVGGITFWQLGRYRGSVSKRKY